MVESGNICYHLRDFMDNYADIQKLALFNDIPEDEILALLDGKSIIKKAFPAGDTILLQGSHYNQLHLLVNGSAFAEMIDVSGKSMRIESFDAPAVLAPGVLFSEHDEMPTSVIAETDCIFLVFSRDLVGWLCTHSTVFRGNFIKLISDRFVFISRRMTFLSFTTIRGKVAQYLLTQNGRRSGVVVIPMKMEELAAYFGATRPSVSRVFIELERKGFIHKDKKRIKILNPEGLRELLL
jgi:CRP/FNR family transcriptional regulator, dissimilatory nitrate respiration regulator